MAEGDLLRIFRALDAEKVRYLVVGGVAVVLHGVPRFTADLDLVLSLEPENVKAAVRALETLGYRPRAPVPATDLASWDARREWILEKNMKVFSFWSAAVPATEVDVFLEEPFPFDDAMARAVRVEIGTVPVVVACIEDVVALKRAAGRDRDLEDIKRLEALLRMRGDDG